ESLDSFGSTSPIYFAAMTASMTTFVPTKTHRVALLAPSVAPSRLQLVSRPKRPVIHHPMPPCPIAHARTTTSHPARTARHPKPRANPSRGLHANSRHTNPHPWPDYGSRCHFDMPLVVRDAP